MSHRVIVSRWLRGWCTLLAAASLLVLAAPAGEAKARTFVSAFDDANGDANADAADLVHARVAYNRRTGALSASLRMAADLADSDLLGSVRVYVVVTSLRKGKCHGGAIVMTGVLADRSPATAWLGHQPERGYFDGSANLDGDTLNLRVRAKALSGRTPGCAGIEVQTNEEQFEVLDRSRVYGFA